MCSSYFILDVVGPDVVVHNIIKITFSDDLFVGKGVSEF